MAGRRVLWRDALDGGAELCRLEAGAEGHRLTGTVLTALDGRPLEARYAIDVDVRWRTRRAAVELDEGGAGHSLVLEADGEGGWWRDAEPARELAGCVDVDLEVTPASNTLPIRRLALAVGDEASIRAVWVRFPTLAVMAVEQRYRRLRRDAFRYAAGEFAAHIEVDADGLVVRYGDIWRAVAAEAAP